MISKFAAADVVVFALVGERGREIFEAADELLATRRCVVVATPPNAPPALRRLTPFAATAVAEHFRDEGADVVLAVDSITRMAHAQRELGLMLDELPAVRAYPPSVFTIIPELIERAGPCSRGTITGFYSVLVESGDMAEPICDVALATLDGHVVLSRELANRGLYPPVDVLTSLSRLMGDVVDQEHRRAATAILNVLQAREETRDLIETGLYRPGTRREVDEGIRVLPAVQDLIRQERDENGSPDQTRRTLLELASGLGSK
jgi:flagellum-specific ATP synthase